MDAPLSPALPELSPRSTWWKRLFTVLEIGVALLTAGFAVVAWGTGHRDAAGLALTLVPVPPFIVRLMRWTATYVVEGKLR